MDFELSCGVADQLIQLLLSEVDRSLAEKQLLTHLNDYNRHQTLKLIMQHLFKDLQLASPHTFVKNSQQDLKQPKAARLDDFSINHVPIQHIRIDYEPNDELSRQSRYGTHANNEEEAFGPGEASIGFRRNGDLARTQRQPPQKRFSLDGDAIASQLQKLNPVEEDPLEKIEQNVMRSKLYEKRRQLRALTKKADPPKKTVLGKNEKFTFDFEGSLIRIPDQARATREATKLKAQSGLESQRLVREPDVTSHQIGGPSLYSSQEALPINNKTRGRFYNNNNSRQTTHIPLIALRSSTKIIEDNREREGPPFEKISRQEFEEGLITQHFRHHAELRRQAVQVEEWEKPDELSEQSKPEKAGYTVESQPSLPKKVRIDPLLLPIRHSFNFEAINRPNRQAPLQKYYRYNYDEQSKRYTSTERLAPIKSHPRNGPGSDRIITNSSQVDIPGCF